MEKKVPIDDINPPPKAKKVSRHTVIYFTLFTVFAFIFIVLYEFGPRAATCPRCSEAIIDTPPGGVPNSGVIPSEDFSSEESDSSSDDLSGEEEFGEIIEQQTEGCYVYSEGRLGRARRPLNETILEGLDCATRDAKVAVLGVKKCGAEVLSWMMDLHPEVVTGFYPVDDSGDLDLESAVFEHVTPRTTPEEMALLNMVRIQESIDRVPEIVDALGEDAKFVLILRDPVERALSDFRHITIKMKSGRGKEITEERSEKVWNYKTNEVRKGMKKVKYFWDYRVADTFEESILNATGEIDESYKLISLGIYSRMIETILEHIPDPANLLVLDGRAFVKCPWGILGEVEDFLGVSPFFGEEMFEKDEQFYCPRANLRPDSGCLNGKGSGKPKVNKKVLEMLEVFYQPFTEELRNLTGVDFPWIP